MDVIWGHFNNMMCIDGSRFPLLSASDGQLTAFEVVKLFLS